MKPLVNQLLSLLIVGLLLASTGVFAQSIPGLDSVTGGATAKRLRELSSQLNLTADQKSKIRPILATEAPKLKALQDDKSLTPTQRTSKRNAILSGTMEQIKPLLNPDQLLKLAKMKSGAVKKHA